MSARPVIAAADVIRAEMERGREVPEAFAVALESAQLLMSPEIAAELERLRARVAELEAQAAVVAEFVADRADYIVAIRNCHPDNDHDYDRWQGHAESRRQLAQKLGLPVAWPPKDAAAAADRLTRFFAPPQAYREDEAAESDRVVAYRDPSNHRTLLCREHGQGIAWVAPVTSEDLPDDGGFCTFGRMSGLKCGRDGLVDGPESGGGS